MKKYSAIELKNLVLSGNIDASIKYLRLYFYKSAQSSTTWVHYRADREEFESIKEARHLIAFVPKDIESDCKKSSAKYFSALEYLKSSEFTDNVIDFTIDFSKPTLFAENGMTYANCKKPLPFTQEELDNADVEEHKEGIDLFCTHIKEVWCSSREDQFVFALNYISASVVGVKVRVALYLQSPERTGKGIILNELDAMLGKRMLKTNNPETIKQWTKPFEGVCLVNLDELTDTSQYGIADKLKGFITEPTFPCRQMRKDPYVQKNTFNIIMSTNNSALSMTINNFKRYVCLDVSEHRIDDRAYFSRLSNAFKKEGFHLALYKFLVSHYDSVKDTWNPEDIPDTVSNIDKKISGLPTVLKFVRDRYVLKGRDMFIPSKHFWRKYRDYFQNKFGRKDPTYERTVYKNLKRAGIVSKTHRFPQFGGKPMKGFKYNAEDLLSIYKKKGWFDPEEDEVEGQTSDDEAFFSDDDHDDDFEEIPVQIQVNTPVTVVHDANPLQKQLDEALATIAKLQEQLNGSTQPTATADAQPTAQSDDTPKPKKRVIKRSKTAVEHVDAEELKQAEAVDKPQLKCPSPDSDSDGESTDTGTTVDDVQCSQ